MLRSPNVVVCASAGRITSSYQLHTEDKKTVMPAEMKVPPILMPSDGGLLCNRLAGGHSLHISLKPSTPSSAGANLELSYFLKLFTDHLSIANNFASYDKELEALEQGRASDMINLVNLVKQVTGLTNKDDAKEVVLKLQMQFEKDRSKSWMKSRMRRIRGSDGFRKVYQLVQLAMSFFLYHDKSLWKRSGTSSCLNAAKRSSWLDLMLKQSKYYRCFSSSRRAHWLIYLSTY